VFLHEITPVLFRLLAMDSRGTTQPKSVNNISPWSNASAEMR